MNNTVMLYTRFGKGIENPSVADLENAISEMYDETNQRCTEDDYVEHSNAWLEYGFQNGDKWSKYILEVGRAGFVRIEKWDDQDDDDPEFEYAMNSVNRSNALEIWKLLLAGNVEDLVKLDWKC